MPLYEYQCKQCGHRFELIQSFSASDAKECPVCQGEAERLISTPARAHFKGSGFYSTDYAAKPSASAKSGDGNSGSDGGSTASEKGGSDKKSGSDKGSTDKPATKTESAPAPAPSTSSSKSD
jgi:putative FmdB family regulatory protein